MMHSHFSRRYYAKGFTLVETLVAIVVFLIVSLGVYEAFVVAMKVVQSNRAIAVATTLANEQIEIIRNLPYDDVGITTGIPLGVVPATQALVRDGISFDVTTVIRNIDDPFDGLIGQVPNDLSPADRRLIELTISCATCSNFSPLSFTAQVGPRGLETSSTNGALFVLVFDADGTPIQGANVHIENNQVAPAISIDDTTNNEGLLQIIDAPPGVEAYEISVTKAGYSSDQTYTVGDVANPNPTKPHATVVMQQVTQLSFAIDETSDLDVASVTDVCAAVGGADFDLTGDKIIGTGPDIPKFSNSYTTNGSGRETINDVEWDTYTLDFTDGAYDLAGTIPVMPFTVNAGTDQNITLILAPKSPNSLLVTVKDSATQLPLSGATVRLQDGGYDETLTTGIGYIRQSDWSGGDGQDVYSDVTKYYSDDTDIDTASPAGELKLTNAFGTYASNGELTSSTFDTGSPSNFHQILWQPQGQAPETGVNAVRFQVATNNDNLTWNFVGPDGTASTYYDLTNQEINSMHNATRYFRYKLFLETADTAWTPIISDVSFTFTSDCVPPGQTFFNGLSGGSYTLTVSKSGYQNDSSSVTIGAGWQEETILLAP
jgi:prepilin-type N-terminal cleavage/methylation domain-containing protein